LSARSEFPSAAAAVAFGIVPLVNPLKPVTDVAAIVPDPVAARDPPVPTSIAAVVLVPEVIAENAGLPPPEHPLVVAPPLASVQSVAPVPLIVPEVSTLVSVPCAA
jgi:hypothetical protein